MFTFDQLAGFIAVAEELHFGRAAERLNMTQPPLSRQIQKLEKIIGTELLERDNRKVQLTPAGEAFLEEARRLMALAKRAPVTARRIATGRSGMLRVGFTAASGYSFLPRLLLQRASHAPNIDIALKEMVSSEQVESLLTGRIDVGLLRPPIERGEFTTLKVSSEQLVAALPFGDPRLAGASLDLKEFDDKPLIMYAPEGARYFHDMLSGLFKTAGVAPVAIQSLSQIHSMLALVRAGMGAALVPEAAMSLHFDDVHFRPVRTVPAAPVELFAAWRSDNDNPALAAFLDLLRGDETDNELNAGAASD